MGGYSVVSIRVFFERVAFSGLHGQQMDWMQWWLGGGGSWIDTIVVGRAVDDWGVS